MKGPIDQVVTGRGWWLIRLERPMRREAWEHVQDARSLLGAAKHVGLHVTADAGIAFLETLLGVRPLLLGEPT